MKKILIVLPAIFILALASCKNEEKKTEVTNEKVTADSLMKDINEGHNTGMSKYGRLTAMQNEIQRIMDSISKLPAQTKQALTPYTAKLDSLAHDLRTAKDGMDRWMDQFNMDSAINNMGERLRYLSEERLKVTQVKETILKSLFLADSVIKAKF